MDPPQIMEEEKNQRKEIYIKKNLSCFLLGIRVQHS